MAARSKFPSPDDRLTLGPGLKVSPLCLGAVGTPELEFAEKITLLAGDHLLLCTDGLWGPLTTDEISVAVHAGAPSIQLAHLMDMAELRTGRASDNLSGILLRCAKELSPDDTTTAF